jgi:tetratricopeptide (TPR) repeat protein
MRRNTPGALAGITVVWLAACIDVPQAQLPTAAESKLEHAVFAICRAESHLESTGDSPTVSIEPGMGDGGFPIATTARPAQEWFNYGIKLYHAFYHEDAKLAFDKAVAFDPNCALCLWGQALSHGPVMNFDVDEADTKAGLEIARHAQAVARTKRDRLLTAAMVKRYSRPQDLVAERDFAADLIKADETGPSAVDLRLLASEVLMTAWRRGDHTAAAPAVALIEPILHKLPKNTAAIHYYIHATEYAGYPARALPYAEQLPGLAPRASHLVHMASHTFFRVGRYEDAATINASALRTDADHLTETKTPGPLATADCYGHNLRFGMAGTLMSGDRTLALKFADHLHRAFPEPAFHKDGMSAAEGQRFTIYARYDPQRMLSLPEPSADNPVTRSLYHYARGEAFSELGDAAGLTAEAKKVSGDDPTVKIAGGVLAGRLAMLQHRFGEAAQAFEYAAAAQDALLPPTIDPPTWWYPIRRSAAAAWLLDGQPSRAAEAAQKSLAAWPSDPLALFLLSRADDGLGRHEDARRDDAQAVGLWPGDIRKVNVGTI